ncbi:MAG TPA: HAD family hydrolase [Polyangia bacterium]|nr:HAD family hydrolase [Polyangia bacterium]
MRPQTAIRQLDPSVLERTLERARSGGARAVVVFDLDSTLLDNRPRQAVILGEFGRARGVAELAAVRPEHWDGWDIRRAMANAGLAAADVERLAEDAKAWWRDRFFTSEYCALDEAIAGAREFVTAVRGAGAQVAYCTGRHEAMRAGSEACFRRLGFPLPGAASPPVHLLMKPTFEITDDAWKESAYERLRALGEVVAVFDNEPTHVNGYRAAFPGALVVHLATDDSGRPVPLADGILSVRNFLAP